MRTLALLALVACSSPAAVTPKPKPLTSVETANGTLRVDDGGTGDVPVIFVHGLAGNLDVWQDALAHVRTKRRAIAFDQHGFGQSPATTTEFSVFAMADDIEAIVKATGAKHVILVGHSYAGHVISEYAERHPHGVAGLVYVDAAGDEGAIPAEQIAASLKRPDADREASWREMLEGSAPGVSDRVLAALRATKHESVVGALAGMFAFDPKAAMAVYRGPRLVLISQQQADYERGLHKVVPGLKFTLIPGTSHWLFLDKPTEFYALLDPFLDYAK